MFEKNNDPLQVRSVEGGERQSCDVVVEAVGLQV